MLIAYVINLFICLLFCFEANSVAYQIVLVVIAVAIAPIIIFYFNKKVGKAKSYDKAIDNDLDRLLFDSIQGHKPIPLQFTLENRKIYIGWMVDSVEPKIDSSYITVLPIFSGHRDPQTLNLSLDIDYRPYYKGEKDQKINLKDLMIVLPKEKVIVCNRFNKSIYYEVVEDKPISS